MANLTDPLDAMAVEARDLLRRVDVVIQQLGVPPGHPVVPLLRTLRMRPGEAWDAVWGTDPERLADGATGLRRAASWYRDELLAPLRRRADAVTWSGAAGDAFLGDWTTRMRELDGGHGAGPVEALEATAEFADAVAGWLRGARRTLAEVMTTVLPSAEAVTLTGWRLDQDAAGAVLRALAAGDGHGCRRMVAAACDIGAAVLSGVESISATGTELMRSGPHGGPAGWAGALAEVPAPSTHPATIGASPATIHIRP